MNKNVIKSTSTVYWVEVWSARGGKGHYVEWGAHYYDKDKALDTIRQYLKDISKGELAKSLYYQEQYNDYTSKPIKLMSQTFETYTYPEETEFIDNILEG